MAQFEYDERGGTFYFFIVAFYAVLLLPATYYFWPFSRSKQDKKEAARCHCPGCNIKAVRRLKNQPWRYFRRAIMALMLLAGWIGFIVLVYKVVNVEVVDESYDPYVVLGIDRGASVEEIKKKYRKWSKIHHPDRGGDPKQFVAIAKAYQALTNDDARENWEKYGNPDGPGATTFGIALPKWIVSKEYGTFVLAGYAVLLIIVLPTGVGIWWYNSIKYSADQVLLHTSNLYASMVYKSPNMALKRGLMVLGASYEFCKSCNKEIVERPSDDREVPMLIKEFQNLGEKNKEKPLCLPYSLKARALIYAHLSRTKLNPDTLDKDRSYILRKCPALVQELVQVSHQMMMWANMGRINRNRMPTMDTLENMMKLMPMLVQATWENKSPLLQLPHFTEDMLRYCNTKKRRVRNCSGVANMTEEERRSLFRNMSDEDYRDICIVLSSMPSVTVESRIEVQGEDDKETITAGSFVTLFATLTRRPLLDDSNDLQASSLTSNAKQRSNELLLNDGHNDDDEDRVDDGDSVATETTNAPQIRQRKPWEKQPKKKKGSAHKPKKKPQPLQTKGKQQQQAAESAAQVVDVDKSPPDATKKKAKRISEERSDDDAAGSSGAASATDDETDSGKKDDQNEAVNEAADNDDDDDDFVLGKEFAKKDLVLETKSRITHPVHCPYYPEDKYEWWWVYLVEKKRRLLIAGPQRVTTLVDTEQVEMKFAAPAKPGSYTFQLCVKSDSYVDAECVKEIKMTVHEARPTPVQHPQWDFPSEDEDEHKKGKDGSASESENSVDYTEGSDDEDTE